ncbi:MAG: lysylphosphatidylglycerol synthase transmembrane domain-containing protein [Actinobacteria bacterium]|nr:lysylphosphatidylglycerol synthase transmembrane domain-containing protein [Actinomycetota bacterium]
MSSPEPNPLEAKVEAGELPVPRKRSTKSFVITSIIGVIIMVGVFALLFPKLGSYEDALAQLKNFSPQWLLALVIAGVLNIVLYPLTVPAAIPEFSYRHSFIERQSGFLISNVIPGGGAFAVGTQYAILSRYGVSASRAAAAVSADAIWTYLLTLGFPALAVILLVVEGRSTAGYTTLAVVGALAVAVSVIAIIVILRSDSGATKVGAFAQKLINPVFKRLHKTAPDAIAGLVDFRGHAATLVKERWIQLTITNTIAQLTPFFVLLCALAGLGAYPTPVSTVELFAAYAIALVLTSFPLTPGGLGTVDAALVALLVAFGADSSTAVAADLIWRLVWFLPQLLVGMVTMSIYLIGKRRLSATPSPGEAT